MVRDTLLGFPAHTLPYRRGKFITLSTASSPGGSFLPGFYYMRLYTVIQGMARTRPRAQSTVTIVPSVSR